MTPFTYETLADALEASPDLVTAMHMTLCSNVLSPWERSTWRRVAWTNSATGNNGSPNPTFSFAVLCWALYLHPATEDEITTEVRGWSPKWEGWSTAAMLQAVSRHDVPNSATQLRRLFIANESGPQTAHRRLANLLKIVREA